MSKAKRKYHRYDTEVSLHYVSRLSRIVATTSSTFRSSRKQRLFSEQTRRFKLPAALDEDSQPSVAHVLLVKTTLNRDSHVIGSLLIFVNTTLLVSSDRYHVFFVVFLPTHLD